MKDKRTLLQKIFWFKESEKIHQINMEEYSINEMLKKLLEEVKEILEGFEKEDRENIIEECLDVIQVILGLFWHIGIRSNKQLKKYIKKHNNKLREREWKFKKSIFK